MDAQNSDRWLDWYRFACWTLGYGHGEAVTYANLRFVEETNRAVLKASGRA